MKHLLTLTALLISSLAMGQMPYNPDSNGDDLNGAEDLQSFLAVYNTMLTSEQVVVAYATDLDSAGTFGSNSLTYYSVPDSVNFVCFPPGVDGTIYIHLNSDKRKALTTQSWPFPSLVQDSICRIGNANGLPVIKTWLFIDDRWWLH